MRPQIRERQTALCGPCFAKLESEARVAAITQRADKAEALRARLARMGPIPAEAFRYYPRALKPLKFVETPGREETFSFGLSFSVVAPGKVTSEDVFAEHVHAFLHEMEKLARDYFTARGFSGVSSSVDNIKAATEIVRIRSWEVHEVLPSNIERTLGDGFIGPKKRMVQKATFLARETGLIHRLWPVLRSPKHWSRDPVERPRDEYIEVNPSGDVVSQQLRDRVEIPDEPEAEET